MLRLRFFGDSSQGRRSHNHERDALSQRSHRHTMADHQQIAAAEEKARAPPVDRRAIVNAILYVNRTGCQWRALPHDFPKWKTVYTVFWRWRKAGLWQENLLTIEVDPNTRTIVQAKGRHNGHPSAEARSIMMRWADREGRADQFSVLLGRQLYCRPELPAFRWGGSTTAIPTASPL